jgi:hypothetical protein
MQTSTLAELSSGRRRSTRAGRSGWDAVRRLQAEPVRTALRNASLVPGVAEKLGYYVCPHRDPTRSGAIFYVGKGQGDRVYQHASGREVGVEIRSD